MNILYYIARVYVVFVIYWHINRFNQLFSLNTKINGKISMVSFIHVILFACEREGQAPPKVGPVKINQIYFSKNIVSFYVSKYCVREEWNCDFHRNIFTFYYRKFVTVRCWTETNWFCTIILLKIMSKRKLRPKYNIYDHLRGKFIYKSWMINEQLI